MKINSLINQFYKYAQVKISSIDEAKHFLENINSNNSFAANTRKCQEVFDRLASGSGRIVFGINNFVIKLAKNPKGVAQNNVESDNYIASNYDIVAKCVESDDDDIWIICERAKKVTPSQFKSFSGLTPENIKNFIDNKINPKPWSHLSNDQLNEIYNKSPEFLDSLLDLIVNFDMSTGDIGRISSWGSVNRNGKDVLVLTDYGLTKSVYDEYYKK